MKRRSFLKLSGLGALLASAPSLLLPSAAAAKPAVGERVLILIELKGGNDGLNTVIPLTDPKYRALRPSLAINPDDALSLSDDLGFNPALRPLMGAWDEGELAVTLGVGYAQPNRSHFRSIDIWETGSEADEYLQEGWVARALSARGRRPGRSVDGVVIGRADVGPLDGSSLRAVVMSDPEHFLRQARRLSPTPSPTGNAALDHVMRVQNELIAAADTLAERLDDAPSLGVEFPRTPLGRQLELAARLLVAGVPLSVIKVSHEGFDTHSRQARSHDRLLGALADAVAALRGALMSAGRWDDTLVMTYSEFGRRAAENGSQGTDHGTAAPHLVMGGGVRGGLFGEQPSLDALVDGDLAHSVDYRRMYATVAARWWGAPLATLPTLDGHAPMGWLT